MLIGSKGIGHIPLCLIDPTILPAAPGYSVAVELAR
jgi:hypothetical protein